MQKLYDLKNDIKSENFQMPTEMAVPEQFKDIKNSDFMSNNDWLSAYFGSDCFGGTAFVGETSKILEIQEEFVRNIVSSDKYMGEFFARWDFEGTSLFLAYDDYVGVSGQPSRDGVFKTNFGAWTDDDTLDQVLGHPKYHSDGWMVGDKPFAENFEANLGIFHKAVKLVSQINQEYIKIQPGF